MSDNNQDPFSEIVGRALIDHGYRDRLMTANDEDQVAAMVDAGLTPEQAQDALPTLREAVNSIKALHEHPVFGPVKSAAA
jgi:hypothetical protein